MNLFIRSISLGTECLQIKKHISIYEYAKYFCLFCRCFRKSLVKTKQTVEETRICYRLFFIPPSKIKIQHTYLYFLWEQNSFSWAKRNIYKQQTKWWLGICDIGNTAIEMLARCFRFSHWLWGSKLLAN